MFRNIIRFSPFRSPLFIRKAYRKSLKVIDSCENLQHIDATSNYLANFLKLQSDELGAGIFEADDYVMNAYRRLKRRLVEKKNSLINA